MHMQILQELSGGRASNGGIFGLARKAGTYQARNGRRGMRRPALALMSALALTVTSLLHSSSQSNIKPCRLFSELLENCRRNM